MSNPTWPATLPPPIADNSTAYSGVSNVLRTEMDAGVAKVRRRFTAVATPFACTLRLTQAQYQTLITFYATTLQDALPFDWTDFRTGVTATYRFVQRPAGQYIQGSVNRWQVTLQLELLP
ncbi:MAG: hypothetical protein ABFC67_04865 [Mizugakiibacter sp.]|uniref:hypothetical protein n=1 Tax=Mizugakiibacter sp. TaxID=1972610 RepID=UPI00320C4B41